MNIWVLKHINEPIMMRRVIISAFVYEADVKADWWEMFYRRDRANGK